MKKLDVRFDTEKVNEKLDKIHKETNKNKSEIARAAMAIGLDSLGSYALSRNDVCISLIEENK